MEWYCIATQPNKETKAVRSLEDKGFDTLYPRLQRVAINAYGHTRDTVEPLFPRYLFALGDPDRLMIQLILWKQKETATGILNVIKVSGRPVAIDDEFIFALILRTDPLTGILSFSENEMSVTLNPFVKGDLVRYRPKNEAGGLASTVFGDAIFKVSNLDGPSRVSLLFTMFGREVETHNIDVDLLERLTVDGHVI